jgi:hypothetical protein
VRPSTAVRTARVTSSRRNSVSGPGAVSTSCSVTASSGCSRRAPEVSARHSRRAVVRSHPPKRSGSRTVCNRSTARSQVFCTASAASASASRNDATTERTIPP